MVNLKLKHISNAGVDSGTVFIGDPCYFVGKLNTNEDWHKWCNKTFSEERVNGIRYSEPLGRGNGIASGTLYGDGGYPIYALINTEMKAPRLLVIDFDNVLNPLDDDYREYEDTVEMEAEVSPEPLTIYAVMCGSKREGGMDKGSILVTFRKLAEAEAWILENTNEVEGNRYPRWDTPSMSQIALEKEMNVKLYSHDKIFIHGIVV